MKTAFVTGYTGQDGTFLTKYLLERDYRVVGLVRRVSTEPPHRVRGQFDFSEAINSGQLILENGDLLSTDSLIRIVSKHKPNEVYNLAAQSDVHISFMQPEYSIESTFMGVVNLITALETVGGDDWRMYQASTSEMFGDQKMQMDENTQFMPNSPYAIAKVASHFYCKYKRAQGRFISCGILFNHESEIRGGNFVTQKICRWVATLPDRPLKAMDIPVLEIGNIDSIRDWGYAGDYVRGMYLMLQDDKPDDFVLGTGHARTVREFIETALRCRGYDVEWAGRGIDTEGTIYKDDVASLAIRAVEKYWRPVDVRYLKADNTKARDVLGWVPEVNFDDLVKKMVNSAINRNR